jgi:hypothetical protein
MFQVLQICRLLDLPGLLLCFSNYFQKLALQSSVESFVGAGFFRSRPRWFVVVGIPVFAGRWAVHAPILHRGVPFLAETRFLTTRKIALSPGPHPALPAGYRLSVQTSRSPDVRDSVYSRDTALSSARMHAPLWRSRLEFSQNTSPSFLLGFIPYATPLRYRIPSRWRSRQRTSLITNWIL